MLCTTAPRIIAIEMDPRRAQALRQRTLGQGVEVVTGRAVGGGRRRLAELFAGLPRRYDELSAALSFWQDPRWRRELVSSVAPL